MTSQDPASRRLGRYEIVRELGKGAMGIVYLARDPVIGRMVALKTIRFGLSADPDEEREFQERFVREAQATGILNHPSIVTVHDLGQDSANQVSFIAMEYVEGANLRELIQGHKIPPWHELAELLAQVAEALDFAHLKGIVHRDIKPANIIVCAGLRAKITDFGIAKIASVSANLTTTGQFLGTPNYMAPEQVKGQPVDGRTDLFSLGVVLYEALTGKKPFAGDSLTAISYKIVHEPFLAPRRVDGRIPSGFEPILSKCLSKEPALRYQRGRDIAADLRRLAETIAAENAAAARTVVPAATLVDQVGIPTIQTDPLRTVEMQLPEASDGEGETPAPGEARSDDSSRRRRTAPAAPPRPKAFDPAVAWSTVLSVFRKKVPTAVMFGVAGALLVVLAGVSWFLYARIEPPIPHDKELEYQLATKRARKAEAESLYTQGQYETALAKYREILAASPNAEWASRRIKEIERGLKSDARQRQLLELAGRKFDAAKAVFDQGDYVRARGLFEEVFRLDPSNPNDPGRHIRLSEERLMIQRIAKVKGAVPPEGKAGILFRLNSPTNDGQVVVLVDNKQLFRESLWEEGTGIAQRKVPRNVIAYRSIDPAESQVVVDISIPGWKFRESRTLDVKAVAGTVYRIGVTLDRNTRRLDVALSE
ncbi:MAG: protein kinase domain-containing protein [Thermoanaerobaculia bacterium]